VRQERQRGPPKLAATVLTAVSTLRGRPSGSPNYWSLRFKTPATGTISLANE
jgi:hypothetical protein